VSNQVVIWNTAGERNVLPCATIDDAKKLAKQSRTLDNQTVKICGALGTLYHWSRVLGAKNNRWLAQEVVNDVFTHQD
jgi:hypothetical protein